MNLSVYPKQNNLHFSGIDPAKKVDPHEAAKQSAFARRLRLAAEEANQMKPAAKTTSKKDSKTSAKKKLSYNFKEVSAQILRAKNTVAAGKAVFQAKRKVVELKRKLAAKDADEEEIAIALTHAKRMEIAARRKQRHLEIEEYAKNHLDKEEKEDACKDAASSLLSQAEERLVEGQEEVLTQSEEEQKAMREELSEALVNETAALSEEQTAQLSEELQEEMQAFFDDAEEQAMEMLSETLMQIEGLEMASPHMSEEDFKEMVQKHRHSEQKEITRADMDYLKHMISYLYEKGGNENCFTTLQSAPQSSFICNVSFEG